MKVLTHVHSLAQVDDDGADEDDPQDQPPTAAVGLASLGISWTGWAGRKSERRRGVLS